MQKLINIYFISANILRDSKYMNLTKAYQVQEGIKVCKRCFLNAAESNSSILQNNTNQSFSFF